MIQVYENARSSPEIPTWCWRSRLPPLLPHCRRRTDATYTSGRVVVGAGVLWWWLAKKRKSKTAGGK